MTAIAVDRKTRLRVVVIEVDRPRLVKSIGAPSHCYLKTILDERYWSSIRDVFCLAIVRRLVHSSGGATFLKHRITDMDI